MIEKRKPISYVMFGKAVKDLTSDERREYEKECARIRAKQDEDARARKAQEEAELIKRADVDIKEFMRPYEARDKAHAEMQALASFLAGDAALAADAIFSVGGCLSPEGRAGIASLLGWDAERLDHAIDLLDRAGALRRVWSPWVTEYDLRMDYRRAEASMLDGDYRVDGISLLDWQGYYDPAILFYRRTVLAPTKAFLKAWRVKFANPQDPRRVTQETSSGVLIPGSVTRCSGSTEDELRPLIPAEH